MLHPQLKQAVTAAPNGKYGRLFPMLPAHAADEASLLALGRSGAVMDLLVERNDDTKLDNPVVPAGWPVFGQFIAHDITADRSMLQQHAILEEIRNFRAPRLDLEVLYSAGPSAHPFMYDIDDADKFLLGRDDLPRNEQGRALIGDPRDDVHTIIAQLHLAFLRFHNAVVDHLRAQGVPRDQIFGEARRLVCWHYQWIAIHEFLPLSVGPDLIGDVLHNGARFYSAADAPAIPVEFADAAYRFGHSQIRERYRLNNHAAGALFPDLAGGKPIPKDHRIDWRYFFALDGKHPPQWSKRIDARLAHALIDLPLSVVGETDVDEYHSLACRDLVRGRALDLPSGQAVAQLMGEEPIENTELQLDDPGCRGEAPLWFYVLKEAELRADGTRLGPVGGRIVAEVLVGLIDADPHSYRSMEPEWTPTLPAAQPGTFTIADLFRFAGVARTVER